MKRGLAPVSAPRRRSFTRQMADGETRQALPLTHDNAGTNAATAAYRADETDANRCKVLKATKLPPARCRR